MALERLLTRREAAEILNVSPRTLERWAVVGGGPEYICVLGAARYLPASLEIWLNSRTITNSSQRAALDQGFPDLQPKRHRGRPRKPLLG